MRIRPACALLLVLAAGSATLAQREAAPQLPQGLLFAPNVYFLQPSIDAVLMLTPDQKTPLIEAYQQTLNTPALLELRRKARGGRIDPADPEMVAAAEKLRTEETRAREEMEKRIAVLLNEDQKATIHKVNEAVAKAIPSVLSTEQKNALAALRSSGRR